MAEKDILEQIVSLFNSTNLSEWFLSLDLITVVFYACGVALFYFVMNMAFRIMSLFFWPTAVIVGLLFLRNETFAYIVTEGVKHISDTTLGKFSQLDITRNAEIES